ncbi:hypothetical protein ACFLWV_03025 [Chloroflexota bacterium]
MHLVIVRYSNDAERKRIEYILDKWKEKLEIRKPDGIISFINGEELEGFIEDLYSRTSGNSISLYRVEKETVDIQKDEREIKLELKEKREMVEKLFGFIMAKQKAVLKREMREPYGRVYELNTKKGKAEISVIFRSEGQGVAIQVRITGYGEVVEFLNSKLSEELSYLESR